jgi:hypothetical protein
MKTMIVNTTLFNIKINPPHRYVYVFNIVYVV